MKKYLILFMFSGTIGLSLIPVQSHALIITEIIKEIILAIDANIQRLQNKTIGLQNAQKEIENALSKLKLKEISDWAEKQRKLYNDYYQELWKVKSALANYKRVKEIMERQVQIVKEYEHAYGLFKNDDHFTPDEIAYMFRVYTGIIDESLKNMEQLSLVVNAFATQMSDGERMEIIHGVAIRTEENMGDLRKFNHQNILLSLPRSKDLNDVQTVRNLYGLN
jgi:hypothetical protein